MSRRTHFFLTREQLESLIQTSVSWFYVMKGPSLTRVCITDLGNTIHVLRSLASGGCDNPIALSVYKFMFSIIMWMVWSMLGDRFDQEKFCTLLLAKHRLYGAKPIRESGITGIINRMNSKHCRIENMVQLTLDNTSGQASLFDVGADTNESLIDTLQDIAGYCVLGIAFCDETDAENDAKA